MSNQNSIAADAYIKSLKEQRNIALDALAERDAMLAQAKMELTAAQAEIVKLKKADADTEPA